MAGGSEWKGFKDMLFWITFGWTFYRSDCNEKEKKYLFIFAIVMTLPPLLWGLTQLLILFTKDSLQLHSVGHVNHSAIYLCMIFGASLSMIISQLQMFKKSNFILIALLTIFLLTAILVTQSRGAFGIAFFLGLTMIFLSRLEIKIKAILSAILLIFIVFITLIKPASIVHKQLSTMHSHDIYGIGERTKVWNAAIEIVRLNSLFGIGNGNWKQIKIEQIKSSVESRDETFNAEDFALQWGHPHNIYLSNMIDRGFFGLITFLSFMFFWLITLIKSYKKYNQDSKAMLFIMGSFSAWTTIFGIGFVNTTFHHENALLALFFLGLHLNYLRQKNQLKLFN